MPYRTRRDLLRLIGATGVAALAAACSQATPAPPTSAPQQQAPAQPASAGKPQETDWDKVVDAAKKEGHLLVATYAGSTYRRVMDDFEAAYPGIKVEQTGFQSSSRDFFPRYFQERQAGLYQWDVLIVPATEVLVQADRAPGRAGRQELDRRL
jgi:ABC-type glycerol-3-phosphate transport system substrate-binding protein